MEYRLPVTAGDNPCTGSIREGDRQGLGRGTGFGSGRVNERIKSGL